MLINEEHILTNKRQRMVKRWQFRPDLTIFSLCVHGIGRVVIIFAKATIIFQKRDPSTVFDGAVMMQRSLLAPRGCVIWGKSVKKSIFDKVPCAERDAVHVKRVPQ